MAIEDSDPERRNLTVMSGAFIIYYLAGGSFKNNEITLEVVNINFSRPDVLGLIAWAMLFWFWFRYWQTHRGMFGDLFPGELVKQQSNKLLKRHLDSILPKYAEGTGHSYFPRGVWLKGNKVNVGFAYAISVDRGGPHNGINTHQGHMRDGETSLKGFSGWSIGLLLICNTFISEPSFAGLVFPNFLAVAAVICGAANYLPT